MKTIKSLLMLLLAISSISLSACSSQPSDQVLVNNTDKTEEKIDVEKKDDIIKEEKEDKNEDKNDQSNVDDKKDEPTKEEKKDNKKEETKKDDKKVDSSSSNTTSNNSSNKNNSTTNNSSSNANKNNSSSSSNNSSSNSSTSNKDTLNFFYINGLKFANKSEIDKQSWCTNWKCDSIFDEKYKDCYIFDDTTGFIMVDGSVTNPVYWQLVKQTEEDYLYREINNYRVANGKRPFIHSSALKTWADIRAKELTTNFSHDTNYNERDYIGKDMCGGENIGYGADPAVILQAWKDSPGHNRALLDEDYLYMEVSVSFDGNKPYYAFETLREICHGTVVD